MTVINRGQAPILFDLAKDVAATAVGAGVDAAFALTVTGVVDFSAPDAANEVRIEGLIDGFWATIVTVAPGATLSTEAFSFAGPYEELRADVKGLGAAAVCNVRAYGV